MSNVKNISEPQGFTIAARIKSLAYALQGIGFMLKTQHNAWLHLIATLLVICLATYFKLDPSEWRWLIVAMAMVWVAETLNTAVEYLCDVVSPSYSLAVKHAKDIAAGGVLLAAIGAAMLGVLTFWPHVWR